jgi:environmental stress-induced protein Ves
MRYRTRADLQIVRPGDVDPEPWANGLGVTRVLAARPAWRISLAEIEGRMPFSSFPGADRVLIPLDPAGVTLEVAGVEMRVPPHSGVAFRGEDRVVAATEGRRVSVVNLMSRRSSGRMRCEIRRATGPIDAEVDALVVLGGRVSAGADPLPRGTVVTAEATSRVVVGAGGVIALLRVRLRPSGASARRGRAAGDRA